MILSSARDAVASDAPDPHDQDACRSVSVLNDIAARNHCPDLVPGAYSDERE